MGYMTDGLTFNTLRAGNLDRLKSTEKFKPCLNWTRAQWLQAVLGELGELANNLKKIDRGDHGAKMGFAELVEKGLLGDGSEVAKELADVQTYLDLLAHVCGVNLGIATIDKFAEVSKRVGSKVWIDHDGVHHSEVK